ncbi:hypothetical protein F5884DRAFT_807705 [Xylogone sp. PMI_703]|nr:hypothetical protein F5884DRAFT_807705 [Xylogone sp. PMI_703]
MSSSIGDVAIIGGGIAGVTLALFLHKHGISSTIYEKRSMHDTETGSLAIAANALRVLDHVGIYKRIRSLGHVNDGPELRNTKGATLGSLALGSEELYGYPSVRTYRNTLWKELLREALEARIDIRFGWIFNEIEREDSESVVVRFVNGERVTAGIVVGADGVHSKLRAYLHPGTNAQYGGQTVVMAFGIRKDMEIRSDEGEDEDIPKQLAIFGESGSFFILTTDSAAEEVLFFSTLEVPDRSREEWESFEADKKGLADMLRTRFTTSEWPSAVHSLLKNTSEEKYTCWP